MYPKLLKYPLVYELMSVKPLYESDLSQDRVLIGTESFLVYFCVFC